MVASTIIQCAANPYAAQGDVISKLIHRKPYQWISPLRSAAPMWPFVFHSSAAATDATGLMRSTPFSKAVQMAEVARNTSMTTTNSKFPRYSG